MACAPAQPVQPLTKDHAKAAAKLHRVGISTGFFSSLGPAFLGQLYKAISSMLFQIKLVCCRVQNDSTVERDVFTTIAGSAPDVEPHYSIQDKG